MKHISWMMLVLMVMVLSTGVACGDEQYGLWGTWQTSFSRCKFVALTHVFNPTTPVWQGFGHARFGPCTAGADLPGYISRGEEYTYRQPFPLRRDKNGVLRPAKE